MKVKNISNPEEFLKVIDSCEGRVELITDDGDRLNLKSKLCQLVSLSTIFSSVAKIPEMEIVAHELEDSKKEIEEFLNKFLKQVSENITYKIDINDDAIQVVLDGEDSTKLIGYRGEALNSIQVILSTIANKNKDSGIKVILDIGTYKEARKKTLEELAVKIEKTVTRTGKSITLEPMTAYERKIIHTKLQESKNVRTYSIGENDNRRIVIAKK